MDGWLKIAEAAVHIRMSERYLRRLVAERRIAYHKVGRSVRFNVTDLDAHMSAGRVEPITSSDVWLGLRRVA